MNAFHLPLRALYAVALSLLLVGLACGGAYADSKSRAAELLAQARYVPVGADQEAVAAAVKALETADRGALDKLLSANFERRVFAAPDTVYVESREDYLQARSIWSKAGSPSMKIRYGIQGMAAADNGARMDVVALSTWQSRFFYPRFLETLSFVKNGSAWQLGNQVVVTLHPQQPAMHEVSIVFASADKDAKELITTFAKDAMAIGPDAALARIEPLQRGFFGEYVVLAVFREPPPVGARVQVDVEVIGGGCRGTFETTYEVAEVTPFAVFASEGSWENCAQIVATVALNGAKLASQEVPTR